MIVFVEAPGGEVGLREMAEAEVVIGVMPDGSGRVLKNRHGVGYGVDGEVSAECVAWLRANPTKSPEDFDAAPVYRCYSCDAKEMHYYHWFGAHERERLAGARLIFDDSLIVRED